MEQLKLKILSERFACCKLDDLNKLSSHLLNDEIVFLVKTRDELSVICDERKFINKYNAELGFKCIKIDMNLKFNQIGIIYNITSILAKQNIPVLVNSTYLTDYFFIKEKYLINAIKYLKMNDYIFQE